MSGKSKQEIEAALHKLSPVLVNEVLAASKGFVPPSFSKYTPSEKFVHAVQFCALQRLERTLPPDLKERAAKTLGLEAGTLSAQLADVDVDLFVNSAGTELLRAYAARLNLEDTNTPRDTLRRNVADEVMLTGTENFLAHLPPSLLSRLCEAMGVGEAERAQTPLQTRALVEALMVHIFQLDPISPSMSPAPAASASAVVVASVSSPGAAASASPAAGKKRKTPTKSKPKPKPESSDTDDEEEEEEEKPKKRRSSATSKRASSGGDDAAAPKGHYDEHRNWVCPPFSTILAGKYDSQGLLDNFNMGDLTRFCKEHGIKTGGKKSACIRAILKFVETRK